MADTGGGTPPEALAHVFEPFYTTKERGTGLGLAYASRVVAEHGGTIQCQSSPGRGTEFTLRLPAARWRRGHGGARSATRSGRGPPTGSAS